jgi:predicted metal-dependent peptidase
MQASHLTKAIYQLLQSQPYYAHFILESIIEYANNAPVDTSNSFSITESNGQTIIVADNPVMGVHSGHFVAFHENGKVISPWFRVAAVSGNNIMTSMGVLAEQPIVGGKLMQTKVPTAMVTIRDMRMLLVFNTDFLSGLNDSQKVGLLKHEVLHMCLSHMSDYDSSNPSINHIRNLAQDGAINQYISTDELPEGAITLEVMERLVEKKLQPFQTSDYYFDALMKKAKENSQNSGDDGMSGEHTMDEHSSDGEGSKAMRESIVRQTMKRAAQKAAGNLPAPIQEALNAIGDSQLPWRNILKAFVMSKVSSSTKHTTKKLNRRFEPPVPGKKRKRKLKLGVCVDSSGSVGDDAFASFWSEITSMANQGVEIVVVDADCAVQSVTTIKSKRDLKPERRGSGGTAYQPAIDECMKHKCDLIIYFGDFDTSDTPKNPGVPFLWVGVGNSPPPADFGKVLRIG